ncbi:MAG: hypothetical protein JRH12_04190 [Deltaproteobacteria bacterium]|nr:hypothetical protein [Deltaproteobacteria bacterium]
MKTRLLKIGLLIAGLMFVFTAASWADSRKDRYRKHGPEKGIHAKYNDNGSYHRLVEHPDNHKFYPRKKLIRKHRQYHRNKWIRKHRRYHPHQWLRKHRPHWRDHRHYSDNSYDDASYNEFSVAATFSEPGVEFSIGTKRTW